MNVGHVFQLIGDIEDVLVNDGVIDASGELTKTFSVSEVAKLVEDALKLVKSEGVSIDPKIDQVLAALPIVLSLLKIK